MKKKPKKLNKKCQKMMKEMIKKIHEQNQKHNSSVIAITKAINDCNLDTIHVPKVVSEAFVKAKGCHFQNSLNWFCGEALYQHYKKYKIIKRIKDIHAILKKAGYINKPPSLKNTYEFNDLDDNVMAYEYGKAKAIYYHMQTPAYVIILIEDKYQTEVHLRRIYDHPKYWYEDDYDLPELLKKLKKIKTVKDLANTISKNMISKYGIMEEISDTLSLYPDRLCIEDYIKTKFKTNEKCQGLLYGDCRDVGYMISFKETLNYSLRRPYKLNRIDYQIDKVYSLFDAFHLIDLVDFLEGGLEDLKKT